MYLEEMPEVFFAVTPVTDNPVGVCLSQGKLGAFGGVGPC